ncbi:MAG: HD superfamily phosphohydrolase [Candidatus Binatia bacterium]|jgi:HD superfamily phosphohydrolase
MKPRAKTAADLESHPLAGDADFHRLEPYILGISDFVGRHLPSELVIKNRSASKSRKKLISDPIVGYVRLAPIEAELLDTPLFQRLRRISQLSFVEHVYPSLSYCRFEHTIGVVGRVFQILSALSENTKATPDAGRVNIDTLIADHEQALRLAALFHDVGHCIYSHASESFIGTLQGDGANYPSAGFIRDFFKKAFRLNKLPPIAEIFAVSILLSPEIQHFVTEVGTEKREDAVERLRMAASFILGVPPPDQGRLLFLAQVISSGLDADKLDYMCRESHYSRIPIGIDIPWLLSKLRIFICTPKTLPRAYTSLKQNYPADEEFLALGLISSGQLEFEEFCFARVSLYDKIYLHQKSRALTAQAHLEFQRFVTRNPQYRNAHEWLNLREGDVSDETTEPGQKQESLFSAMNPSMRLLLANRAEHFHRAYAFGPRNSLTDPFGGKDVLNSLPSVQAVKAIHGKEEEWTQKIEAETRNLLGLVPPKPGENISVDAVSVAIDTAQHLNIQQGHDSLYFQRTRKSASRWILPVDMIVDYYRRNRSCGYVFTSPEVCHYVAVAAEVVFWKEAKQQFSQDDAGLPPHLLKKTKDLKAKLTKKGYYDDLKMLKPVSRYLSSAAASELTHDIASKLAGFQSYNQERVTPQRVAGFAAQFPEPLHEVALQMCSQIDLIEPAHVANQVVDEYLRLHSTDWKDKRIALVPLGSIVESGALLSYNFKNHSNLEFLKCIPKVETLSDNVVMDVDAIIFYDDNINSGSQLVNIFADRLGKPLPADRKLAESHGSKLSDEACARLITLPLHFVFGVAPDTVLKRIQKEFLELFVIPKANVTLEAGQWLRENEKSLSGLAAKFQHKDRDDLRKYMNRVGTALMLSEGKSQSVAEERALGDENAEALIAFPYNVPTMTVLPLWCEGDLSASDLGLARWMPLIERRRARDPNGKFVGEDA